METRLCDVAEIGDTERFLELFRNTNYANPKAYDGWTPLHVAAEKGRTAICKAIIDKIGDVDPKENDGWTPLVWDVVHDHT